MILIPNVHAVSLGAITHEKMIISAEMKSILIKGFISGAFINLSKNVLLHPIETGMTDDHTRYTYTNSMALHVSIMSFATLL